VEQFEMPIMQLLKLIKNQQGPYPSHSQKKDKQIGLAKASKRSKVIKWRWAN